MRFARTFVCGLLLCASNGAATADSGFYFGALGGKADYEFERPSLATLAVLPTFTPRLDPRIFLPTGGFAFDATTFVSVSPVIPAGWLPADDDDSDTWGIVAGYRIMRYAAVEVNYLNFGTLKETDTVLVFRSTGSSTVVSHRELETRGPSVSALGILPLLDRWNVYLRAGVLFADMELSSSFAGSSDSITFGADSFLWGAGTQFDFGKHWSVRADFQRFDGVGEENGAGRADIDLLTLGVLFRL